MTPEQAAAYVYAQAVAALATIEGMKAANRERENQGYALAYDEAAFDTVAEGFCISHNQILATFEEANRK